MPDDPDDDPQERADERDDGADEPAPPSGDRAARAGDRADRAGESADRAGESDEAADDSDAEDDGAARLSAEEVEKWLRTPEVKARMLAAIRRVMPRRATAEDVEDALQRAMLRAARATRRPLVGGNTLGWFGAVAAYAGLDAVRRFQSYERRRNRKEDFEERVEGIADESKTSAEDVLAGLGSDDSLSTWLEKRVAKNPKEKALLELMMQKARENLTSAQAAAIAGISPNAYDKRVQALHVKYADERRRYLRRVRSLWLFAKIAAGAVLAAAVAYVLWRIFSVDPITRDPSEHARPLAPPPASVDAAPPPPFDQALPPPQPTTGPKP
jgi:DNA-directed RNA polymerase specialized sigma24 family protein